MKEILSNFWINILSALASIAVISFISKNALKFDTLDSIGIGVLFAFVMLSILFLFHNKEKRDLGLRIDNSQRINSKNISGSNILKVNDINVVNKK
jgi:hypothetical protein